MKKNIFALALLTSMSVFANNDKAEIHGYCEDIENFFVQLNNSLPSDLVFNIDCIKTASRVRDGGFLGAIFGGTAEHGKVSLSIQSEYLDKMSFCREIDNQKTLSVKMENYVWTDIPAGSSLVNHLRTFSINLDTTQQRHDMRQWVLEIHFPVCADIIGNYREIEGDIQRR